MQIVDTSRESPEALLRTFEGCLDRCRILVCGGDGTAGWVLNLLDKVCGEKEVTKGASGKDKSVSTTDNARASVSSRHSNGNKESSELPNTSTYPSPARSHHHHHHHHHHRHSTQRPTNRDSKTFQTTPGIRRRPPVAILPLGTGNDLARVLGWGGGWAGESVTEIIRQVENAVEIDLDRWLITVKQVDTNDGYESAGAKLVGRALRYARRKERVKQVFMNNYLSVGMDASITLDFHTTREKTPQLFRSRLMNKAWYALFGGKRVLTNVISALGFSHLVRSPSSAVLPDLASQNPPSTIPTDTPPVPTITTTAPTATPPASAEDTQPQPKEPTEEDDIAILRRRLSVSHRPSQSTTDRTGGQKSTSTEEEDVAILRRRLSVSQNSSARESLVTVKTRASEVGGRPSLNGGVPNTQAKPATYGDDEEKRRVSEVGALTPAAPPPPIETTPLSTDTMALADEVPPRPRSPSATPTNPPLHYPLQGSLVKMYIDDETVSSSDWSLSSSARPSSVSRRSVSRSRPSPRASTTSNASTVPNHASAPAPTPQPQPQPDSAPPAKLMTYDTSAAAGIILLNIASYAGGGRIHAAAEAEGCPPVRMDDGKVEVLEVASPLQLGASIVGLTSPRVLGVELASSVENSSYKRRRSSHEEEEGEWKVDRLRRGSEESSTAGMFGSRDVGEEEDDDDEEEEETGEVEKVVSSYGSPAR
ncbi:hypothetical protein HK102_003275, partial [Quaeritorhiza haematococci]